MSVVTGEQRVLAGHVNHQLTLLNSAITLAVKAGLHVDVDVLHHRECGSGGIELRPIVQIQVYEKEVL